MHENQKKLGEWRERVEELNWALRKGKASADLLRHVHNVTQGLLADLDFAHSIQHGLSLRIGTLMALLREQSEEMVDQAKQARADADYHRCDCVECEENQ